MRPETVLLAILAISACGGSGGGTSGHDAGRGVDAGEGGDHADGGHEGGPEVDAQNPSVTVTIRHGYGGGTFAPSELIPIWSDADPQHELTTGWTGATHVPTEWNGVFTVPKNDVTLTASIVRAPVTLVTRTYALSTGKRSVLGHFPSAPQGLVLFFHGAQFDIDQLRSNAASTITIALVRAGYAVVALPSEAETMAGVGGWDPDLTGNTDLDNVRALVAALQADGTVTPSTPRIAWGMSSGGIFAHTVGAELPTAEVVAYCAPGTASALAVTKAKTAWYLAKDDQTFPTSAPDSKKFQAELRARGVATDLYVHPPTPLYDERFERVAGVDASRSKTIADSLRSHAYVDAQDNWLVTGSSITLSLDLDGLSGLTDLQKAAVGQEIDIMAADHALYDDVANRMVAFLDE